MMAAVAMINESLGDKQMEGSRLEKKFRKAVTKEMNLTKKRKKKRSPGMWSDVRKLIELARGGQNKVHWVTAMLALVCYTGIRRFSDINRMQVKDVCFKSDGTLEFYMARSKTDENSEGLEFVLAGAMIEGISVGQLLRQYIIILGLKQGDCLFPRVSETKVKSSVRCVSYAMAYRWLEKAKGELDLSP
jgi:hypothetical protein